MAKLFFSPSAKTDTEIIILLKNSKKTSVFDGKDLFLVSCETFLGDDHPWEEQIREMSVRLREEKPPLTLQVFGRS